MDPSPDGRPLGGVLSEAARELLRRERNALSDLRSLVARLEPGGEAERALATALEDLDGLLLLVVVGEFNTGKSSLVNALLGAQVMAEGVTPTTDRVTLVVHGDEPRSQELSAEFARVSHPAPRLRDLALVDTPGTNAVIAQHQLLTERFVPRADLVLFVTSADRALTETERGFLQRIAAWGRRVTVVVNKVDMLAGQAQLDEVVGFVRRHAREALGYAPEVLAVSTRQAIQARAVGDEAGLEASGLAALERHLAQVVDLDRVRLKLDAGLGVAAHVADRMAEAIGAQRGLLQDDSGTLEEVDRQQARWAKDVRREANSYLDRVKTVLLEVERRGEVFFDDTVQLSRLFTLMRPEKVREAFEERVLADASAQIDHAVTAMSDWFIERTLQQWEDVVGFVRDRRQAGEERVIGEVGGRFRYDREALITTLRDRAESVLDDFDPEAEARRLAEALQASVVQTGLMQVGGLGLGAAVVALVSSAAWDLTGIAAGLTLMGLGLLVLPRRRAKAKRELHQQMSRLREGLEGGLGRQIEEELQRAAERLSAAIAPYTRFVRVELERLDGLVEQLEAARKQVTQLRAEVAELAPGS